MSAVDIRALLAAYGEALAIDTAPDALRFYSQDVFAQGAALAAVIRPRTVDALAGAVGALTAAGVCVIARGGGLSYSDAFLATDAGSVLIDTAALDRIVEINALDRYVTVECGVTWAQLDAALAKHGLRTPYWGPLSGLRATVGGALSQGSVFLGSAQYGAIGDSVLALDLITADGELLQTGSAAAQATAPFTRWFGPDLTGAFIGDAGTLAIKARATLRLLPRPTQLDWLSFEYANANALLAAMAEVSRQALASECVGFDPTLAAMRMQRAGVLGDARALGEVVRKSGVLEGLKVVAAGRRFLDVTRYSLHLVIEADSPAALTSRVAAARKAAAAGAQEIENTIPKVLRAQPFTAPNAILGPAGERWVPVHGIVPHSAAPAAQAALDQLFAAERAVLDRFDIKIGCLYTVLAQQGTLIEPVFYWPDSHTEYHQRVVDPGFRARAGEPADNPEARAEVARLKRAVADSLRAHGAVHFQLGKFYRWREGRNPAALRLHDALKHALDPHHRLNPGALV